MGRTRQPGAAAHFDIAVIGGGINGCGIARDAAGRGYSVLLAEMNDLASGTSGASTKLIHGGLRYLEHYEFKLVREALSERELLWRSAPHIISPARFVLPYHAGMRPAFLLRVGLFIYDHIGGRKLLAPSRTLDLRRDPAGAALKPDFSKAFEYSDCRVDDARLVVLAARDAADRGALILTRTKLARARRVRGLWHIVLEDQRTGKTRIITARALVNAAGPWVDAVLGSVLCQDGASNVRLVQGAHIVVDKLFDHDRSYIFQNEDGRIVFAIPFERDFTLIGTTDLDHDGAPSGSGITSGEQDYLCAAVSDYFAKPVSRADIVWSFAGLRPLYDDGASAAKDATRDYVLKLDSGGGTPPLLNVFGGKLTTFRRLAEAALEMIEDELGSRGGPWTKNACLPGGDFEVTGLAQLHGKIRAKAPFLSDRHIERLARSYGNDALRLLASVTDRRDLGRHFGADLYDVELRWLMDVEWAECAEDVVWRRSKLGLRMTPDEIAGLDDWMAKNGQATPAKDEIAADNA